MKHTLLLTALLSANVLAAPVIDLGVTTEKAYGMKGHGTYTYSSHDIQIMNDTANPITYNYQYSLCVNDHGCMVRGNSVTVNAHSRWNNHADLTHFAQYDYSGPFESTATTQVDQQSHQSKSLVIIKD